MANTVAPFLTNVRYFDSSTLHGFSQFGFLQFNNLVKAHNSTAQVIEGTHQERLENYPAANYSDATLFYETDRGVFYVDVSSEWTYATGVMQNTQSNLPTDLSALDAGFLFAVTDYEHLLSWSGTKWEWGPGEGGSGFIVSFVTPPSGPGWHVSDGSKVSMLTENGTLTQIQIPAVGKDGAFGNLVSYFRT